MGFYSKTEPDSSGKGAWDPRWRFSLQERGAELCTAASEPETGWRERNGRSKLIASFQRVVCPPDHLLTLRALGPLHGSPTVANHIDVAIGALEPMATTVTHGFDYLHSLFL